MFKKLWRNRIFKTIVVTAAGGALGAIMPMLAVGSLVVNSATLSAAASGAVAAVVGLYVKKPEAPAPKP